MAINKELYERYKAMKAAKLAAAESGSTEKTSELATGNSPVSSSGIQSGFKPLSSSQEKYENVPLQNDYSSSYYSDSGTQEVHSNYSSQFVGLNSNIQSSVQIQTASYSHGISSPSVQYSGNVPAENYKREETKPSFMKFALIGYPLGHSLSKYIHIAGFESLGIKASYELIETPPEKLVDTVKYLKSSGYSGFNVTIPLKLPITMFLDEIDSSANTVNAINTVTIDPTTKFLKGYNTDAIGFKRAIPNDIELCGKVAGVLGTGGAARAAICALVQCQVKEIKLYTRNVANSIELLEYLRKTYQNTEFNALQIDRIRDLSDIDILVNATPIGMQGHAADLTPVEERELLTLKNESIVYDVIYNPKKTKLIKLAQSHNYRTVTGLDMLIYQAIEAQKIWTGRTPDFKDMKIAALENL